VSTAEITANTDVNKSELLSIKLKAFGIHISLSALLLSTYAAVLIGVWYPPPFFWLDGSSDVIKIVVGIDLVAGPLLTFLIFKPGKPGLKMDLSIIVIVQLIFLAWGIWATYTARPLFVTFNVDRFTIARGYELDMNKVPENIQKMRPARGPLMVYSRPARDSQEKKELLEGFFFGKSPDLAFLPERYLPVAPHRQEIVSKSIDIRNHLRTKHPGHEIELDQFLGSSDGTLEDFIFLPVEARLDHFVLILRRDNLTVAGYLPIDPW